MLIYFLNILYIVYILNQRYYHNDSGQDDKLSHRKAQLNEFERIVDKTPSKQKEKEYEETLNTSKKHTITLDTPVWLRVRRMGRYGDSYSSVISRLMDIAEGRGMTEDLDIAEVTPENYDDERGVPR